VSTAASRALAILVAIAALTGATPRPRARPPAIPRVRAVSGTAQSVLGYAAIDATAYDADFKPLVVRVPGHETGDIAVRFWCVTPRCIFPKADVPDTTSRVDTRSWDVKVAKGEAVLKVVTLEVKAPGTFLVLAAPVVNGKVRSAHAVRFVLTVR
jgi:hypothetical protein